MWPYYWTRKWYYLISPYSLAFSLKSYSILLLISLVSLIFFILLFYSILHGERNFKGGWSWCSGHVRRAWEVRHFWSFSGSLWGRWSSMKDTWIGEHAHTCLRTNDSQSYNDKNSGASYRRGDDDYRLHSFRGSRSRHRHRLYLAQGSPHRRRPCLAQRIPLLIDPLLTTSFFLLLKLCRFQIYEAVSFWVWSWWNLTVRARSSASRWRNRSLRSQWGIFRWTACFPSIRLEFLWKSLGKMI